MAIESAEVNQYADRFLKALADPVVFAREYLSFQPFQYQTEFLKDQSPLIAACCGRQVGKTTLSAIKALQFALHNRSVRILIVSAGLRQSILLFDKILNLIDSCIVLRILRKYNSRTRIRFANGSEIVALPCGRDGSTLRGLTADMVILDEANFIPRIVIESVIRPTTITRPKARIIMISTPWTKDHPFHEAINNLDLGFKTYHWPTRMNPLVKLERLEQEKRAIGEHDYNREYDAIFLDDQYAYFPGTLILNCTDTYNPNNQPIPQPTDSYEYHIGVDFGKHTDHSAIVILRKNRSTHHLHLEDLEEFPLETPYTDVIAFIRNLNNQYKFNGGCLDQTGVGEAPCEMIKNFNPKIEGITLTVQAKVDLMGKLRLTMENRELTLPASNKRLLTQIANQQCRPLPSGNQQFTHPTGTKDDLLWALALATQSALTTKHPPLGYIEL